MATIIENQDKSLTLVLDDEERGTYEAFKSQFIDYATLWLKERFRVMWQPKIEQMTRQQKEILVELLKDVIADAKPKPEPTGRPQ